MWSGPKSDAYIIFIMTQCAVENWPFVHRIPYFTARAFQIKSRVYSPSGQIWLISTTTFSIGLSGGLLLSFGPRGLLRSQSNYQR